MEYDITQLAPLVQKYREEMAAIEVRRELWNNKVKESIKNTLQEVIDHYKLEEAYIESEDDIINQEVLFLGFHTMSSGIVLTQNGQNMIRYGGGLFYAQNHNGKISVQIIYPHIEGIKGKAGKKKNLKTFKPEKMTKELIISHIERFLREILEWECFLRQTIGFNHK